MLKKFLLVLALGLLSSSVWAQGAAKDGTLALLYDVDSATLAYCSLVSQSSGPWGSPIPVAAQIKTTGSNTTVTELVSGSGPFTQVIVGDVLVIQTPTATNPAATTMVAVTARASAASITVDTAINITGNNFGYFRNVCGTTATDGWFAVGSGTKWMSISVQYDQGDLTAAGLAVRWECKDAGPGAQPVILYPGESSDCGIGGTLATDRCTYATPGITSRLKVVDQAPTWAFCRVGLAFSAADTSDATTNLEKVTVTIATR